MRNVIECVHGIVKLKCSRSQKQKILYEIKKERGHIIDLKKKDSPAEKRTSGNPTHERPSNESHYPK